MKHAVCPWWVGYLLASPLRRLLQDPAQILAPHVRDPLGRERGAQRFTIEVGEASGGGPAAHIHEQLYSMGCEKLPERLDRPRRVSNGVDHAWTRATHSRVPSPIASQASAEGIWWRATAKTPGEPSSINTGHDRSRVTSRDLARAKTSTFGSSSD